VNVTPEEIAELRARWHSTTPAWRRSDLENEALELVPRLLDVIENLEARALLMAIPIRVAGDTTHYYETDATGDHLTAIAAYQARQARETPK
jgi:hypothetical protein